MGEKFLNRVYGKMAPAETQALYDAWAATYEAEISENGYATPGRLAKAMAKHVSDTSRPLLDFGCGTGLSGLALQLAGFTTLDGMDPSAQMLNIAREKSTYRTLTEIDIADPSPVPKGAYDLITAIGVIGIGAAPASTIDMLLRALPRGGLLGLSLNDHALREKVYEAALCQWLDTGAARLLVKEYGPHLPAQNIKSNVYIIEKA
ncbi:methyltransferase domain-containing protein [Roseovarius faecimaris]|uniref:Methyltransferase domain-containing protein n=1 Tax=Roseovarius faecimaris TaxID=2494550 RepID=A0A6I6IPW8_9RHOB|nr:methyltransferase domain-containing protein [Roseovarius faecimaris]QGX98174.1 methyltransferase domain-containing protein [Roseovarius faecimaris]